MADKQTQDIVLDGRKVTVHILRVRDSIKVDRLREEALAAPMDNSDDQILIEHFYPFLAACSEGAVPTALEFLNMTAADGDLWFKTVDELNPGLLPKPSEDTDEKKES